MHSQLRGLLESLLKMIRAINDEVLRLGRTDQFNDSDTCLQLIENIRGACMESLQNLRTVEHRIHARGLLPPEGE